MVRWHHWDGEGKPGVLQAMWSPRVRHNWATEQQTWNHIEKGFWETVPRLNACMCVCVCACLWACSVMFDSLWPHRLQPTRLLCTWNFPGKNTEWVAIFSSRQLKWADGKVCSICLSYLPRSSKAGQPGHLCFLHVIPYPPKGPPLPKECKCQPQNSQRHFCYVLLVRASHKASPDLKGEEINSTSWW